MTRRWTYTLGVVSLILSAASFYLETKGLQIAGLALRYFGTACIVWR
ncbi:MAG: hypothetical protein R3D33_11565 [Hyphomicrobiaceae bacterium]